MSSGNPFGLAEISHFGAFQRVGGKAGGFINKKFFHPSSFKNQEKLWQVMTADATEKKKQAELEKRRDEERQVEELRKQMYLAGQGKQLDNFSQAEAEEAAKDLTVSERANMKALHDSFRMRKESMKLEKIQRDQKAVAKAAGEETSDEDEDVNDERELAKSRYEEDRLVLGHTCVWGSWYTKEGHKWGYKCCHGIDAKSECTMCVQQSPEPSPEGDKKERPLGTKRARRRAEKAAQRAAAAEAQADELAASPTPSPSPEEAPIEAAAAASSASSSKPIVDEAMLARAEARRSEKRQNEDEEVAQKKPKDSSYLANLLADPAA